MRLFRPVPPRVARLVSLLVMAAWAVTMGVVLTRAYVQARSFNLATDLAQYGAAAEWRGVYYRGEKMGFTVSQTTATANGFAVQEDARIQMALLGATTAALIRTRADLDRGFALRSFEFSLDPGTGPILVSGRVSGTHISLTIKTPGGTQTEERDLPEAPVLALNLPRRLASQGFKPGTQRQFTVFDPATLRNEAVTIDIGKRELVNLDSVEPVSVGGRTVYRMSTHVMPAFRVDMTFSGLKTSSWITDTGDVVREESQLGLMSVRETPDVARRMAISRGIQGDMLESAAVIPRSSLKTRITDSRDVRQIRMRLEGPDLANPDMQGAGQTVEGDVLTIQDARSLGATALDPDLARYLKPEPLLESDDPGIQAEALAAVAGATDPRVRAERLTRRVNSMLEKKPTVSLPSAREVLRTKVGDCNEHTALYVAMARSIGLPARIAVGLAYARGAFYYHAWPEVYITEGRGGLWLPVDPTFNQFPADAVHVRLARGGLDKQAAILPLIGHVQMTFLDLELAPNSTPILVGRGSIDAPPVAVPFPVRTGLTCWASPVSRQ